MLPDLVYHRVPAIISRVGKCVLVDHLVEWTGGE
jgi:hypothetical protein